jgi:hypothetical protein
MKETPEIKAEIKGEIKQRFVKLALVPQEEQKFAVGPASAKRLGYDPHEIDSLPPSVRNPSPGWKNPLALGELRAGQTVLDIGCGAGLDSILAARRVAPRGKVNRPVIETGRREREEEEEEDDDDDSGTQGEERKPSEQDDEEDDEDDEGDEDQEDEEPWRT